MNSRIIKENKAIKFFVIVPVYKTEKYIQECIDSVLNQTYQNFKLILVDDGSPDNSGNICEQYAVMDSRIIVIHQKNMGSIAARQAAIKFIKGLIDFDDTFIVFLDSDDSLKEKALEKIYQSIQKYDCDMVIYGMERVLKGEVIVPYDSQNGYSGLIEDKNVLYNLVFNNCEFNSLCRKAISALLISDMDYRDYYHLSYGEDLLQSITYYKNSKNVYILNESLYNYTFNPDSLTNTISEKNFEVDFTIRKMVYEFLQKENIFTPNDWKRYRSYCVVLLVERIKIILQLQIDKTKKYSYFEEIYNSDYFQNYIRGQEYERKRLGKKALVYFLFKKKLYLLIIIVYKFYKNISKRHEKSN